MSGRIPRHFIDDLLLRVDIVDLIDSRVPLKKTGSNYVARCPFHNEKTPSFSVNRNRQTYHCFGCGAGGNAIGFLMEFSHLGFVEAVEDLAGFLGVDVPRESGFEKDAVKFETVSTYDLLEEVAGYYAEQLKSSAGKQAVEYLKGRGVTGEIAKVFGLGFAPAGWNDLVSRFDSSELEKAGLVVVKESGGAYDRFRDRLMFPIRDKRKRVIGFGGRVLDDSLPKYLNSPETPVFSKGKEVYGLCELLEKNSRPERVLVVEGYMDVITLYQYGVHHAVATLGTSTSKAHLELLFRFTSEVVFCFDGDVAGRQAAWRAAEAVLPVLRDGRQVKFMLLPQGQDPDSFLREKGVAAFVSASERATLFSEYFFDYLKDGDGLVSVESRSRLAAAAKPLLEKLPAGVFKEMMLEKLADLTGVSRGGERANRDQSAKGAGRVSGQSSLMRKMMALLVQNPQLVHCVGEDVKGWSEQEWSGIGFFRMLIDAFLLEKPQNSAMVIECFRETEYQRLIQLLANLEVVSGVINVEMEFRGALNQLLRQANAYKMNLLIEKVNRGESLTNEETELFRRGGRSA